MAIQSIELTHLIYLKNVLETAIAEAQVGAVTGMNLSAEELAILTESQVVLDPDSEFSLVGSAQQSTPILLLEMGKTVPIDQASNGFMIRGAIEFTLVVVVTKEGRSFSEYKTELITLVAIIEQLFLTKHGARIAVGDKTWTDFPFGELRMSGCIMDIQTSIGTHDYSL